MNKIVLFIVPLIVQACFAVAQVASPAPAAPTHAAFDDPKAPRFAFIDGDTHDFGEVEEGPEVQWVFKFKNTGKQPLIITRAYTSGGGDVAEWEKEPIQPGKMGEIRITFHTAGKVGQPFYKRTVIVSNAASKEWANYLYIKGQVVAKKAAAQPAPPAMNYAPTHPSLDDPKAPRFKFLNGETHDFGTVEAGPDLLYVFKFKNIGKEPLIISHVSTSDGATIATWEKEPVLPGKSGKIGVHFYTAGRGDWPFNRTIYITSNAASEKAQYELHIEGRTVPERPTSVPGNPSIMR